MNKKAYILLKDKTILSGYYFGKPQTIMGELVFNTSMTGYQDILTDPSYAGQVIVMTYPLIGNYGINTDDVQSNSIKAESMIVNEIEQFPSNFKSQQNINDYFFENNKIGIYNIDTRFLTLKLRDQGLMNCLITNEELNDSHYQMLDTYSMPCNLVAKMSTKKKYIIQGIGCKIAFFDFGVKGSILDELRKLNCEIHVFPYNTTYKEILDNNFDAVFLSNGPGDPDNILEVVENIKILIGKLPIFGICLGIQILGLALGGKIYKLKFGHRGANHPVMDLVNNKVIITSQNHSYAVDEKSLPSNVQISFKNINDDTVEGFCIPELNVYAVQFHPEARPGPQDALYIFKEWIDKIK